MASVTSRISNVARFAILMAILLTPAVLLAAGVKARAFEERPLNEFPAVDASRILDPDYYKEIDAALTDLNPAREAAVIANARFSLSVFGDIQGTQVVLGRDGWLFLAQTLRGDCIDAAQLEPGRQNLEALARALADRGIPTLFTVAADKASIFPDKLRAETLQAAECRIQNRAKLQDMLASADLNYFDAWAEMTRLRESIDEPVYFPHETHWSEYGALEFSKRIARDFAPELEIAGPYLRGVQPGRPDLGRMAGVYYNLDFPIVSFERPDRHNRNSENVEHEGEGRPYVRNTSQSPETSPLSNKRILFLHDSFMYVGWDQVSQYFGDAMYMHWTALSPERFAELASVADAIVIETVERETFERLAVHFADARYADAIANTTEETVARGLAYWPRPAE